MGKMIHWKKYGLIVTIAGAELPGPGLHGQNVIAKNEIISPCCTYVST